MSKPYLYIITALFMLACSVSTLPTNSRTATAREGRTRANIVQAVSLGRYRVRSAPSTNAAELGWYEAGGLVVLAGDIVPSTDNEPQCASWYPVQWRGKVAYVCAAGVAR